LKGALFQLRFRRLDLIGQYGVSRTGSGGDPGRCDHKPRRVRVGRPEIRREQFAWHRRTEDNQAPILETQSQPGNPGLTAAENWEGLLRGSSRIVGRLLKPGQEETFALIRVTSSIMETKSPVPRAILVGIQVPSVDDIAHAASLDELGRLVKTLGYEVVGTMSQKRDAEL
jgi:hypothetical protein